MYQGADDDNDENYEDKDKRTNSTESQENKRIKKVKDEFTEVEIRFLTEEEKRTRLHNTGKSQTKENRAKSILKLFSCCFPWFGIKNG